MKDIDGARDFRESGRERLANDKKPPMFYADVIEDAVAHFPPGDAMRERPWRALARVVATSAGFRMTLLYRTGHGARAAPIVGRFASKVCFWLGCLIYKCSIAGAAEIGGGLILPHPQGIVIGGEVRIGGRAWIFQNVTIGGSPLRRGQPTVGEDSRIYAGAVVAGPVTLGHRVTVGANAVVGVNVPDDSVVTAPRGIVCPAANLSPT